MVDESIFEALLTRLGKEKKIAAEGETVRLESHKIILKEDEAQAKQTISRAFGEAGLAVPSMKDVLAKVELERKRAVSIVQILIKEKSLVKITEDLMFHQNALEDLCRRLADFKKKKKTISVREFKDLAGVSRKYAIPLLEYLDRERVTRRQGDERLIL
jgi:selenocysteine-specific elongation factor